MIETHQFRTRAALVEASTRCARVCVEEHGRAYLIVPGCGWAEQRKAMLRTSVPMGVRVLTLDQLVDELWGVFGDGTRLVTAQQRRMLIRSLAGQLHIFDYDPSTKLVEELARFVQDACISGLEPSVTLTDSESKIMELVSLYERELEIKGLLEPAQAQERLDAAAFEGRAFVFEQPAFACEHDRRFVERLASAASVHVIEQIVSPNIDVSRNDELLALQGLLFSGEGGLAAGGRLVAAEATGYHAQAGLLVKRVRELLDAGAAPSDIVIAQQSPSDAYPQLFEALADADIPFAAEFSLPVARTGLGSAFCELMALDAQPDERQAYEYLSGVLATPYSGVTGQDARAVQAWWRARAGSSAKQRMDDLTHGYTAGSANSRIVREHLEPCAQLLAAGLQERVALMFEHAHAAHLPASTLIDDRAAAETILDYLEQCAALGATPHVNDLGNEPVALARGFKQDVRPLLVVGADSVGLAHVPHIIMPDLDTAHYPMATKGSALDTLRAKLGLLQPDTTALERRLLLLNLVESTQQTFTCARSPKDAMAEENCASALWDELMAVYRSAKENDPDNPLASDAIPAALEPYACKTSEMDEFRADAQAECEQVAVERGAVHDSGSVGLLTHRADDRERVLSPTQIEDYYRCPYRWFTSRRVGYSTLDREFDQSALGSLFHDVMARFYPMLKEAGYDRVTPENLPAALEVAERAFADQLAASKADPKTGVFVRTQQDAMVVEELHEQMLAFVERDAAFLPGFTPTYFEVALGDSSTGPIDYAGVSVSGKVDRIDVAEDGRAVIIDYKLSGLSAGYGLESDADNRAVNRHVQTDVYALVVERHFAKLGIDLQVIGSVYRSYAKNVLRGAYDASLDWGAVEQAYAKKDALPLVGSGEDYPSYIDRVESKLATKLQRLQEGYIAPDPIDDDACNYCKALGFCPLKEAM